MQQAKVHFDGGFLLTSNRFALVGKTTRRVGAIVFGDPTKVLTNHVMSPYCANFFSDKLVLKIWLHSFVLIPCTIPAE